MSRAATTAPPRFATGPDREVLERNLGALARSNPDLAVQVHRARDVELDLSVAEDGHLTGDWKGRRLASRHRPLEEAERLVAEVDLGDVATIAVFGFGLGLHVELLARRLRRSGIVIVVEPDCSLLKAVFARVDLSEWIQETNVLFVTDATDRVGLVSRLAGMDAILMLGLRILEHPASAPRMAKVAPAFSGMLADLAATARMNVVTTLGRSAHTIANLLANVEHAALGADIRDLKDIAQGRLGIIVAAGPSLRRNMHLLAEPGVRERAVIIATQTTLRPLLDIGVAPHFVTALDYHEISTRFYEGLTAADVSETELIIDPKVNPAVPQAWPGRLRTIPSEQLDRILGPLARAGDALRACSTVAHLAYEFARHCGCNPVALIGQDLGFTDALYYAPGTAIHEVWRPELNQFNTIETMEWERIARHRGQLEKRVDIRGRTIYTDEQMLTYLSQFEAMFHEDVAAGRETIDASEGGVRKACAEPQPLARVLEAHAFEPTDIVWPKATCSGGADREAVAARLEAMRNDTIEIRDASRATQTILAAMIEHQRDEERMASLFTTIDHERARVAERGEAFHLVDLVNQAGVFRRLRADRRLECETELDDVGRQRALIDRDAENVEWTGDAAEELSQMLAEAVTLLSEGTRPSPRRRVADLERAAGFAAREVEAVRVAAVIAVQSAGIAEEVLQSTVERLKESRELAAILVLAPEDLDLSNSLEGRNGDVPVSIVRHGASVFGLEHEAIILGRAFARTCWRGGLNGLTAYDEVFAPKATAEALDQGGFDGALLVGPDWALLPVGGPDGVDQVVRRFREQPRLGCTFNQAPPGLGGLVLSAAIVHSFAEQRSRHASIGHVLGYRPERPEHDLIARDNNVSITPSVRSAAHRFVCDSPQESERFHDLLRDNSATDPTAIVEAAEHELLGGNALPLPRHLTVELLGGADERGPIEESLFRSIAEGIDGNVLLSFGGAGDPLRHPMFDVFLDIARKAGFRAIHLRTNLDVDEAVMDRLLAVMPDLISVDLDGDSADTRRAMHGVDLWERIQTNLERLIAARRVVGVNGSNAYALPWIIPRLQRRAASLEDLPAFFERWRRRLGTAVIGPALSDACEGEIAQTSPPERYTLHQQMQNMTILSDGTIPLHEEDFTAQEIVGSIVDRSLGEAWAMLVHARLEGDS